MTIAGIEVKKGKYYASMFFLGGDGFDWLGVVWRDLPDGHWQLTYRVRHYRDRKVQGSKDEKNWYSVHIPSGFVGDAKAELLNSCRRMMAEAKKEFQTREGTELPVETDDPALIRDALLTQDWAHPIPSAPGGKS